MSLIMSLVLFFSYGSSINNCETGVSATTVQSVLIELRELSLEISPSALGKQGDNKTANFC